MMQSTEMTVVIFIVGNQITEWTFFGNIFRTLRFMAFSVQSKEMWFIEGAIAVNEFT